MPIFYNLVTKSYKIALFLASPLHSKAKKMLEGRKNIFATIAKDFPLTKPKKPLAWFHCASLGEFEQGRTLLENFKKKYPAYLIVLTFFSPSGYEIRKNYEFADFVYYLPFDSAENAKKWLDYLQPTIIFFVKYEFWHYYLQEAKTRNIITISFSAIFRQNQLFFSPYAKLYPQVLQCFSHIFVQNENSLQLLQQIGISSASIAGDTRLDRVLEIAKQAKKFPIVDNFTQNSFVCVLGSTWEDDIAVLAPFFTTFSQKIKIIIAPHEISENKLKNIEKAFYTKKTSRYSQSNVETVANFDILLVDTIGMLSSLYAYGNIAFVGGGYGDGLHNILEPAVFGLPIFFGNKKYKKFQEAIDLLDLGAAFAVGSAKEMEDKFLQLYTNEIDRDNISKILATYMQKNQGGTKKIIDFLANNYPLCEY